MTLPEWWIERGIGETRLVLIDDGHILEARIQRDDVVPAGTILAARLKTTGRNAIAVAEGREYLLPKGAPGVSEGGSFAMEIVREALGGAEPWKRPLARVSEEAPRAAAFPDARDLPFPSPVDGLESAGWSDLIDEARSGIVTFAGGALRISLTPAMTLIDVDGHLEPAKLAVAGARAAAAAIRRLVIAGSIGIDLPTAGSKNARQAAAEAFDAVLPQPFERTAVNGFGFLQIVRPRRHASLLELAADRAAFEARVLLRHAATGIGALRLAAHPAVIAILEAHTDWTDQLARQIGGPVSLRADASLAMGGGHAEPA